MMKYFKLVPMIFLIFGSPFSTPAIAATTGFAQDAAHDMLRGNDENVDDENENADTASKWGATGNQSRTATLTVAKPLDAIDDSSFESTSNRAPASMRGPATVKPVIAKSTLPAPKTMVRTLRQKKAFQEAAVIVSDLGFFPSTLFVTQGIPVRLYLTGASQRSQCIILDAFGVRRQIRSQKVEEVTFTPDQAGKFSFSCPMNGAKGTIIVKELEIATRLPASEPVNTAMAEDANTTKEDSHSVINDSDFGTEFRQK